jgi:hypothetical protein
MLKRFRFLALGIVTSLFLSAVVVNAATVDKTSGVYAIPANGLNKVFILKNTVDISEAANADVYQCLKVGTGTYVLNVFTEIVTPNNAATTSTVTVGDGAGASSFDASANMRAAAGSLTYGIGGTDAYVTTGRFYTGADTIDLTFTVTGTNSEGSVIVRALCVDLN